MNQQFLNECNVDFGETITIDGPYDYVWDAVNWLEARGYAIEKHLINYVPSGGDYLQTFEIRGYKTSPLDDLK